MKKLLMLWLLIVMGTMVSRGDSDGSRAPANFSLLDLNGRYHELQRSQAKLVVLYFTAPGCPLAKENASKLRELRNKFGKEVLEISIVYASSEDANEKIRRESMRMGFQSFPILRDVDQAVTIAFSVNRTAEVVALERENWNVIYQGALNEPGKEGTKSGKQYLASALDEFLNGKSVTTQKTEGAGQLLAFKTDKEDDARKVTYVNDVAPILQKKCVNCHSPGNIGPFAFDSYSRVKNKSRIMEEVLLTRRMPPWHADPHFGTFENDRSLTAKEIQTLLRWVREETPRGDGEDPLVTQATPAPEWPLGKPDYILKLPAPEKIPPTGVLEYRHIQVDNPISKDVWLGAIAIKPGNRKVVHHVILRAQYPKVQDDGSGRGTMISGWAPGYFPERYPENSGRFLPAGATFDVELHYNTIGVEQTDETEIGFYLLEQKPRLEFKVQAAVNTDFSIPPGETDARTFATYGFERDGLLFALSPHMHLRGSWFKFEALYPDGRRETLLSVPRYDFNWQTEYRFEKPKRMARGTWILCSGGFDNSPLNPANPNPKQRVTWGDQSFEEMFIGFMDIADLPEGTAAD
jgi:peroxiredoxin